MSSESPEDYELFHYGVQGMKWGVRKATPTGASRRTNREARKDAKEYTKAKMFYGEGAGTRRKLVNATVNTKRSKDPTYGEAFDYHVKNTDMAKRAENARGERRRKDAVNSVKKTTRGVKNTLMGNAQYATVGAIAIAAAGQYAYRNGGDQYVKKYAAQGMRTAAKAAKDPKVRAFVRKVGLG